MSLGPAQIIQQPNISPELAERLLKHRFFTQEKPPMVYETLDDFWTNYITPETIRFDADEAILEFVDTQGFDYSDYQIEYWFQDLFEGRHLGAHCDYNHIIRVKEGQEANPRWIFNHPREKVMSPITIAAYLHISDDMEGGELCVSEHTWFNEHNPFDVQDIKKYPYKMHKPKTHDVLHFNGSTYFHWVEQITKGTRKSVQINFWRK